MKRIALFFTTLLLVATTVNATNTSTDATNAHHNFVRGYGNSFIFMENGIEFSVFPDGQFDFFMPQYAPNVNVGINTPGFTLSFNGGFDYNPFIQYDDFGAIIQIENTPIFYDYFGRVTQIGNINIVYNGFGRVNRIGGLFIHYRNRVFSHYTGFINPFNRFYVFRPWHRFYTIPAVNYCIVSPRPYRQFYRPIRHTFYRPYINNVRQPVRINSRRGAVAQNTTRRNSISDRYVQEATPRRNESISRNNRSNETRATRSQTRGRNTVASTPRTVERPHNSVSTRSNTVKSKTRTTTRPRTNVTKSRNSVSKRVETRKSRTVSKPKVTQNRTYNKSRSQGTVKQKASRSRTVNKSTRSKTQNKSTRGNSRRTR